MPDRINIAGFTLIELMATVGIISILATAGGFGINSILPDLRLSAAARELKANMNLARLQAVRENKAVLVAFHPDRESYDIRIDSNGNGSPDDEDTRLKTVGLPGGLVFTSASFGFGKAWARFDSRGLAYGYNGTASLHNIKNKQQDVIIAPTGRVRIVKH